MGKVLFVILIVAVVWFAVRSGRNNSDAVAVSDSSPSAATALKSGKPFTLEGTSCRLSGNGRVKVVGEHYRRKALERAVKGQRVAQAGDWANALRREAVLIPEPSNKFDKNAVRVMLEAPGDWVHVGYLAAEDAAEYVGVCNRLIADSRVPLVNAGVVRTTRDRELAVYLHLAGPGECLFTNNEPDLPVVAAERQCAVTRESHHQDVLSELPVGLYWATLHPSVVTSGKFGGGFTLEVRIDGHRVGELTSAQGLRYRPLLPNDQPIACESTLFVGKSGTEVTLALPRVD